MGPAALLSMDKAEIEELRKALRRAMQRRVDAGLVPNAGQWVPRSILENAVRKERARARVHALELLLLYIGVALISLFLLVIVWYLSS